MIDQTCPTCGSPVKVYSGGEGTNSYEPTWESERDRLAAEVKEWEEQDSKIRAALANERDVIQSLRAELEKAKADIKAAWRGGADEFTKNHHNPIVAGLHKDITSAREKGKEVEKVASYHFTHEIEKGNCLTCARWEDVEKERDLVSQAVHNRNERLESRLAEAEAGNTKMRNALGEAEWGGWDTVVECHCCPSCLALENEQHQANCLIKQALLPAPAEVKAREEGKK